jgi:DNA-binding protein H-NS
VAKINLSRMDVHALIDLRKQVEDTLVSQRSTLERQLAALGGSIASIGGKVARGGGRGGALKGKKVAPKYRSPDGETWAGRGATPRWLKAAIKDGKKLESFLIEKTTGGKVRKKRKSKG